MSAVLSTAVGAVLLTASPAAAQVEADVFVSPEEVRPGHTVRVTATGCITDNPDAVAEAYSNVFPTIGLEPYDGGKPGNLTGTATVFHHAQPGTYDVNVACDVTKGASGSGTVTVIR